MYPVYGDKLTPLFRTICLSKPCTTSTYDQQWKRRKKLSLCVSQTKLTLCLYFYLHSKINNLTSTPSEFLSNLLVHALCSLIMQKFTEYRHCQHYLSKSNTIINSLSSLLSLKYNYYFTITVPQLEGAFLSMYWYIDIPRMFLLYN